MLSKKTDILTIDFDFFQLASADIFVSAFPHAFDLEPDMSASVWGRQLALHAGKLEEVSLYTEKLDQLKGILLSQPPDTPVLTAQSHLRAYSFILDLLDGQDLTDRGQVTIYNIDMHHDIYNESSDLNCGNWLGRLRQDALAGMDVVWIANPASRDLQAASVISADLIMDDLSVLMDRRFSGIFLCRSDSWLHPKFDADFSGLLDLVRDHFSRVDIVKEKGFPEDRYRRARLIADSILHKA